MEPEIVLREDWLKARIELLEEEKAFTRQRDALSAKRRQLPRVRLKKDYRFEGESGALSLSDLFGDHSQLIVYHFMFGPDWSEGCPSCSFWVDNYDRIGIHLEHRDTSLVTIARAPISKLLAYRDRMGWNGQWVSAYDTDFNQDFNVSFDDAARQAGEVTYNFQKGNVFPASEAPGISVFLKDPGGVIYHTYSTYSRGLDMLNGAYHFLDLMPKGRGEDDLDHTMSWLRRRDQY